jgi:hypothetical protein
MCYLLVRLARRDFVIPKDGDTLFELDWMPNLPTMGISCGAY